MGAGVEDTAHSPSEAYAALSLGASGTTGSMSGSQDGDRTSCDGLESDSQAGLGTNSTEISRALGRRSASPAKRSASDMEQGDVATAANTGDDVAAPKSQEDAEMQDADSPSMPPANHAEGEQSQPQGVPTLDDQVRIVTELSQTAVQDGERGYLISSKWLAKVYARSSYAPKDAEYGKEALEGEIGPVNNSDLVSPGAFEPPTLKFNESNLSYIPIKSDLTRQDNYEILPEEAWKVVVKWYGLVEAQQPIIRLAHDTAPDGATSKNIQYDIYPPVFTIRKMVGRLNKQGRSPTPPVTDSSAQPEKASEQAAVQIVAGRQDRFQSFLARSKRAAGVPIQHKVRLWRQLDAKDISVDRPANPQQPGMLTPATSRSASPTEAPRPTSTSQTLVIDTPTFLKMDEGVDYESIDAKDETGNANYNGSITLDILGLDQTQTLILEEQIGGPAGGEFASDARRKKKTDAEKAKVNGADARVPPSSGPVTRGRTRRDGRARGTIGLVNLGNTCYMNSALQCISRIEELAIYFLETRHKREINSDNPLGYNGRMANSYGTFMNSLYQEGASAAFSPRQFKGALGQAQPMFTGYGQQDSQEFLSFLVDALHEDLNRIHKKPYIENPDSDDATVHDPEAIKQLGETYRTNHRARNDSIAMDLFNGFYKNTMVCPDCKKISVTFDPYSLLTLQLPIENTWQHNVFFIPQHGKPSLHLVDMDKHASVKKLKDTFANKFDGLTADQLFMVEIFNKKIYKAFSNNDAVSEISDTDIISIYELPQRPTNIVNLPRKHVYKSMYNQQEEVMPDMESELADNMVVTVHNRVKKSGSGQYGLEYQPTFITVTRDEAKDYDTILRKVLVATSALTSRNFLSEDPEPAALKADSRRGSSSDSTETSDAGTNVDGQISDRSVPSEDEYVNVSVQSRPSQDSAVDATLSPSSHTANDVQTEGLQPGAFVSPGLRSLFDLKYTRSPSGDMHCASTATNMEAFAMIDRVQRDLHRRGSLASLGTTQSQSTEDSTSSARSRTASISDVDSPDLVIGDSSSHFAGDVESDEDSELPTVENISSAFGKNGRKQKYDRKRARKIVTYSKNRRRTSKQSERSNVSRASVKEVEPQGNPYYIRLGEGIVLDWTDEGWDALFGGDPREPSDMRGYMTLNRSFMEVTKDPALETKLAKRRNRKSAGVTLEECFAETAKTETLSEENAWYCNRCKELRRADKTLEIWTTPDILVLHLKRFSGERYRRDKVDVLVDFPIEGLDLTERIGMKEDGKECLYDLFAVDNHYGGLGGGHYTAIAKNFFDGKWYDFNDSSVSQAEPQRAVTPAAYLLFYRRRSVQPLGPPYLRELVGKARNPVEEETTTQEAQTAENSDDELAGEGSLGGPQPFSRLHGSSSDGTKAGAGAQVPGALRPLQGSGATNAGGLGAGRLVKQGARPRTATSEQEDEGISLDFDDLDTTGNSRPGNSPLYGPARPPTLGGQWSFDNIPDHKDDIMSLSTTLNNTPSDDEGDAASDIPALGSDIEADQHARLMEDFGSDAEDVDAEEDDTGLHVGGSNNRAGFTTPLQLEEEEDDGVFRDNDDEDLYADVGMRVPPPDDRGDDDDEDDPPVEEVRLDMD